jgi:ABC-type lipoprotein release transport system permease subunit
MRPGKLALVILQNVRRNRKHVVFSVIGITVGVSVFSFFIGLTFGIREEVLDRIYPVDLIEVEPAAVNIGGAKSSVERLGFNQDGVATLLADPGIGNVFPKLRSRFQATYRIGGQLFGEGGVTFEAYFDGLDEELLRLELTQREKRGARGETLDRLKAKYGRTRRCYDSEDCSPGEECGDGACRPIVYSTRFRDTGEFIPCQDGQLCADGYTCLMGECRRTCEQPSDCGAELSCRPPGCRSDSDCGEGRCEAGRCTLSVCVRECGAGRACPDGQQCIATTCATDGECVSGKCVDGQCALAGSCTFIPCMQESTEADILLNPLLERGILPGLCEGGGAIPEGGTCPPARCPRGTYCSVHTYARKGNLSKDKRGEGRCELPIPVVLNPIVLELFNMVLASTLDKTELGTVDTLLGYGGSVTFGHSFYKDDVKDRTPVQKKMMVVGFSNKALEAGVTMPMAYVERANARYKGKEAARQYDSMIVQLAAAEHLPDVLTRLEQFNVQLSRRSAEAEKFRTVLLVAIAIFFIMASIIMGIAAVNITHTFLMVIYERKMEIGIIRALGATQWDIRVLFLGESLVIGLAGGALGNGVAYGLSRVADFVANRYIGQFPFQPDTFFHFRAEWLLASVGFAIVFSLVGALFPANRAAAMDPARTLTMT